MIISYRHKFILFKNHKVGSSSIEAAIRPHLGPKDIASPSSDGKKGAALSSLNWPENMSGHMFPETCAELFPEEFKGFTKLTIERNSFDKAISLYFHQKNTHVDPLGEEIPQFSKWVKSLKVKRYYRYYSKHEDIIVFDYYRLSDLANFLSARYGFSPNVKSFSFKSNYREKVNIHSLGSLWQTQRAFKYEIKRFKYTYSGFCAFHGIERPRQHWFIK